MALASATAPADQPAARIPRTSFSHMVPETAGVFAEMLLSDYTKEQLRVANLGTLLRLLPGREAARLTEAFDWGELAQRNLGMDPKTALNELFGRRVAVAAPSWERLGDAVILIRLKSKRSLDPIIDQRRIAQVQRRGRLQIYRTHTGLWIASDGRIALFSQDGSNTALLWSVVDLVNGGKAPRLSRHGRFTEQVGRLQRGSMAYLYFAGQKGKVGGLETILPDVRCGVVGMIVHQERVSFEVRAQLEKPRPAGDQPAIDLLRMQRLPDSALLAWATSLNPAEAYRQLESDDGAGEAGRYLELFKAAAGPEVLESEIISKLGQRIVVVWDRVRGGSPVPQLSVLLETEDPAGVAAALAGLADALAHPLDHAEGISRVERIEHLDAEILTVGADWLSAGQQYGTMAGHLLSSLQPSFAAMDGWVVASTSAEAARQILAADRGLIPRLEVIPRLGLRSSSRPETRTVMGVAQPAMASAVVASWLDEDSGSPWALGETFGSMRPSIGSVTRPALGVRITAGDRAGSVLVVEVHPDTPADGELWVDDEIIGVDGKLLALDDPVADLRRRIADRQGSASLALRLRRDEHLMDVSVPLPNQAAKPDPAPPEIDPLEVLGQLRALGSHISYATHTVYRSPPDHFHARVSLQLAPRQPTEQPGATPPE